MQSATTSATTPSCPKPNKSYSRLLRDATVALSRISPTKAGVFCLPNYCPLCCWRLLRMNFAKPYYFPPAAVLNQLDAQQKQMARVALDDGQLPDFFGPCADATELLEIDSMSCHHQDTDLLLYGKPDFVFVLPDNTIGIVDGKTAYEKKENSPLYYMYEFQVNFYAYLAEQQEDPYSVSCGGLLYFEFEAMSDTEIRKKYTHTHMLAKFRPNYVAVTLDPEGVVVPVLERVRKLMDMEDPSTTAMG